MSKLFRKAVFILCIILTFLLLTAISAIGSVKEELDKHRVSRSDKSQIEDALKESNYQQVIEHLYPTKSKVTLSEPVKLFILKKDNILKNYNESLKLTKFITKDYDIIQSIKDESNNIIGIIHYRKGKGLIEVQDTINNTSSQEIKDDLMKFAKEKEGKWYVASMGGGLPKDAALLFTDFKVIKQKLEELGVYKVTDIYFLGASDLPMMIYIRTGKEEYVFPVSVYGEINYETGNLYKLEDLINYEIKRINKNWIEAVPSAGTPRSSKALQPVTDVRFAGIFSIQSFIPSFIVFTITAGFAISFKFSPSFRKKYFTQ